MTEMRWFGGGDAPRIGIGDDRTVMAVWPNVRLYAQPGRDVVVETTGPVAPEIVQKLRTGTARALRRYLQGATILHAAAVAFNGHGVVIAGNAGAGKSTTGAALCGRGGALLSDDSTVVTIAGDGVVRVEPVESSHWLDVASSKILGLPVAANDLEKNPTKAARLASEAVVVRTLVVLEAHDDRTVIKERLRGVRAMSAVIAASLRIPIDKEQDRHDFDAFAHIAANVPVYRVLRPTRFSATLMDELVHTMVQLTELR